MYLIFLGELVHSIVNCQREAVPVRLFYEQHEFDSLLAILPKYFHGHWAKRLAIETCYVSYLISIVTSNEQKDL